MGGKPCHRAIAGNTLEHARTLLEMGVRFGDPSRIQLARHVFDESGARVDFAFCLHACARMEAATRADSEAALEHYNRAITALDAVKAEHTLGVACRERAQLLQIRGREDEARADLLRAERCFAAIEVNSEKITLTG